MGFVGSLLGLSGNGGSFNAQSANIQQPITGANVTQAMGGTNSDLAQQQAFANAVGQQGGLANQSNVFNQQQGLVGQEQGLASQLQGVANGTGPNPALAQLNQTTGQNVSTQAALMGSQRGVGANAGMLARQAAMQGAATQQQAAGQGATLAAQQQLGAMSALGQQQQNIGNTQQQLANTSQQQIQNQAGTLGQLTNAQQAYQQNVLGGLGAQNTANIQNASQQNSSNEAIAGVNAQGQQGLLGGLLGGAGTALSGGSLGSTVGSVGQSLAHGGAVHKGPKSIVGRHMNMKSGGKVAGQAKVKGDSKRNDTVPAMLSPGEIVVPRSAANDPGKAAAFAKSVAMRMTQRKP